MVRPLKMLVYGSPGAGKTTLCGSGAQDARLWPGVIMDFEGGALAIESKITDVPVEQFVKGKLKPVKGKIDVVRITTWAEYEGVLKGIKEFGGYKLVCVDSLTEINYLCLGTIVGQELAKDPKHEEVPELRDYLKSSTRMRLLVRMFRDLQCHTIFVCGLGEEQNARTKLMQKRPALTGKLTFEVCGLVDVVGYLAVEDPDPEEGIDVYRRVLVTSPSDNEIAKDRSEGGKLQGELYEPTLPKILDLLED